MSRTILLVEDNADDEVLTLRALKKNNILNEVCSSQPANSRAGKYPAPLS